MCVCLENVTFYHLLGLRSKTHHPNIIEYIYIFLCLFNDFLTIMLNLLTSLLCLLPIWENLFDRGRSK